MSEDSIFDAADVTWASATIGSARGMILYRDVRRSWWQRLWFRLRRQTDILAVFGFYEDEPDSQP